MPRVRLRPLLLLLSFLSALASLRGAQAKDFYFWTQATATGLEARAVVEDGVCPGATIDGAEAKMRLRAPASKAFPVTTCALDIPKAAGAATIAGRRIPLPPARIDRILLVGDTGCRLSVLESQDCNSMRSWPFRLVADLAAERAPDLVIHLGDVVYRERPCSPAIKGCAGSPFGDNFDTWKADWLEPAKALLETAPIVFVRGNHEDCKRNGLGWTRFLSAFPFAEGCNPQEEPYFFDLGDRTLAVLDVTRAEDRISDEVLAPFFHEEFAALAGGRPVWIAMHKPVYAVARMKDGALEGENKTLSAAVGGGAMPQNVEAALSGHMHLFEALSYAQDFPAQIVAGMGGTRLDTLAPPTLDGQRLGDMSFARATTVTGKFGYAMLERQRDGWLVQDFDAHGATLARCTLSGRKLACEQDHRAVP